MVPRYPLALCVSAVNFEQELLLVKVKVSSANTSNLALGGAALRKEASSGGWCSNGVTCLTLPSTKAASSLLIGMVSRVAPGRSSEEEGSAQTEPLPGKTRMDSVDEWRTHCKGWVTGDPCFGDPCFGFGGLALGCGCGFFGHGSLYDG